MNHTIQTQFSNQIQGYESNQEMFNLTTGMEMIEFSKNLNHQNSTDDSNTGTSLFFGKASIGKNPNESSNCDFYQQHDFNIKADYTTGISETGSENLLLCPHDQPGPGWQENNRFLVDDSSLRCVFPCEGNERPSQGLSLSLSSNNPSSIGLQSFELRHTSSNQDTVQFGNSSSSRDHGFFEKSSNIQQNQIMSDGFLGKAVSFYNQGQFQLRNSMFLDPARELLNEFCSLGSKQSDNFPKPNKPHKFKQWEDDHNGASSSRKQPLSSLEFMELQERKTKLFSMLEEVERRYKHYSDQMGAVVSSFEAVAGNGAAKVYSALASIAMSRHFRCLKDGILKEIEGTRKAMGEKDLVAPGTSRGETPRLRLVDQTLRQQKALQQMNMLVSHPWRPQRGLPERAVSLLRAWLFEHFLHPYPSDVDKHILARQTGLSRSQVSNWFINARVRLWKPMVEEMYLEEAKEEWDDNNNIMTTSPNAPNSNPNPNPSPVDEQKPTPNQPIRIDSECFSSIINNQNKNDPSKNNNKTTTFQMHSQQNFGRDVVTETFGSTELGFSSYANHHQDHDHDVNINNNQKFNGGGGVSLTLGLQQHGGNGVSIAFSPTSQNSVFYSRDHHDIDECQPAHEYSLLDGDHQGHNLPYRNLMGAQLLHDLAG